MQYLYDASVGKCLTRCFILVFAFLITVQSVDYCL